MSYFQQSWVDFPNGARVICVFCCNPERQSRQLQLVRCYKFFFEYLWRYLCSWNCINVFVIYWTSKMIIWERKNDWFPKNIFCCILRMEGWDTRKGACMTRYVRSAQVTLEVTGTGCYRGKGGLRKQSWGGGIFNPKLNTGDSWVQFIIVHIGHQIF